jgi:hypothetical protein
MLPRLLIAIGLSGLIALCIAAPTACSSSPRRDQNYGTDKGADYRPEAGVFNESDDAQGDDDAGDATDSTDDTQSADAPGPDLTDDLDAAADATELDANTTS